MRCAVLSIISSCLLSLLDNRVVADRIITGMAISCQGCPQVAARVQEAALLAVDPDIDAHFLLQSGKSYAAGAAQPNQRLREEHYGGL